MSRIFCTALLLATALSVTGQVSISGLITDDSSKVLSFVTVHLLNTEKTTYTDHNGNFTINIVRPGKYVVELSSIGFATTANEIEVREKDNPLLRFQLHNSLVQLESVTITAEKKEEVLQKIPLSVTALSSRQVLEYRLWNAKELTAIVPNLYSGSPGDERNVTSIRGITTTSYNPAVVTYVDGVNQFSLDNYIPQLSDIERIEVLRGPQGTLYGRNAMGGVINIITKAPSNTVKGFVELNFGNYDQQRHIVGISFPLIKNKLFAGFSGVYRKRDGYYINQFNNSSFDKQHTVSGNYYLKYLPGEAWSVTLNVKNQYNRNNGPFPLVIGADEAFKKPFQVNQDAITRMIDNSLNASVSVNHTGSKFQFNSQTSYQTNYRIYENPIDGDFSPLDIVTIINNYGKDWNNVKVLTEELRFNSSVNKSDKISWTAGSYFFYEHSPGKQATHFGKDARLFGAPDTNFSVINFSTGKNSGIAVYGQINYRLTNKSSVVAGVRYDYEHKHLTVRGDYQKDGENAIVTRSDTSASANFNAFSPKIGFQYELNKNARLFTNYSRGFRTGGLTPLSSDPSQPPLYPFKPEYSDNIEIGIKNNLFDERLFLNATIFLTYITNAQVPTLVLPDAITITRNTGKLTSKGIEIESHAAPLKGVKLEYSFGYTDAKYSSLKLASNGTEVDLNGKKQIFTPEVTSMLALQYSYQLSKKNMIQLIARGEWIYLGTEYFDLNNTIRQSPHNILNARLGFSSRRYELFFWLRNIANTKYIEYAYDFGAVHLGNPQTYGATLRTQL